MKTVFEKCDDDMNFAHETFGFEFVRRRSNRLVMTSPSPSMVADWETKKGTKGDANSNPKGDTVFKGAELKTAWNRAVLRVDRQALEETWDAIADSLKHFEEGTEGEEDTSVPVPFSLPLLPTLILFLFTFVRLQT